MIRDEIGVLRKVRVVVDMLAVVPYPPSTANIADLCGLSKASAERYLAWLERVGVVRSCRDATHRQRRLWRTA